MTECHLAGLLENSAGMYPERTAVVFGDTRLTYAQVDGAANQVANLLVEYGVKPGDKVALSCPNLPFFPIVYFGILKAGATVVPLNVLLKTREVAYHLDDSGAVAYFAFEGTAELPTGDTARQAVDGTDVALVVFGSGPEPWSQQSPAFERVERDDDTAVILYTSGTTGQPKGAELRHRNMHFTALSGKGMYGADAERPDTYLCALPLFHAFGQTVIQNAAFAFGGTVVMLPRFEAASAIATMVREKVTFFAGVPTMYWGLLGALTPDVPVAEIAANLRVAASGGSALPAQVHTDFQNRFGVTILEGYGLSETSAISSFSVYGEDPRVGSIGKPIAGVEMKLINDDWSEVPAGDPEAIGEIAIKGPQIMKCYHGRHQATAEAIKDGWFRSGDLARRDGDDYFVIVDRSKDMIIRGGYNVYPRELEEMLMTHPAISLVAVVGVPHVSHGEEIKAIVVAEPGAQITADELVAWGREHFAAYKYPRLVEFRDALPMTSTGKILKRELS
ncbi:long-chain-fatty-acid--CoA ligase [Streptomyces malaysiensis]|uniref:long-chain-fatty-acid--CoA ligase n=1 Tax=Streptomyces malaysiensis TaxID=92644 RepID=UPI000BFE842C|nr:long-chain fatty acid--CoA ligase [Streptomyces malaysiensis]ATL85188.1 AMP-dependent synthetase and ligase [Streptomyces malaysiensis]QDL71017.1 long-chain fatty acid--CoA ligase [Streptomyces malaysiensis]